MSAVGTATASIEVACDPKTAFAVFTDEIAQWWKRGTRYWDDSERALEMRFEPYVGGRLIEVYDLGTGEGYELGRVSVWEPGERLVFGWRLSDWPEGLDTEVDVRFLPVAAGTLLTLEHRGWERFGPGGAQRTSGYAAGWVELLGFYSERVR